MDDSTKSSPAKTMPFGSGAAPVSTPKATPTDESARAFAERGVVERHGEPIRTNPNFRKMVDEEMRQIEENRKNTEGM